MVEKAHQRTGYRFKYPRLLGCAFQHPTYPSIWEKLPSYQRLEFLGDALLDMACIDYLFHRYPGADPQWLTEHKMAMVSNQFLGCLAISLQFHKTLKFCSPDIQKEILDYVTEIEEALGAAKEEAVRLGGSEANHKRNYWVDCSKPPKCLPDVVEAYVGAVFVDSEYDYSVVERFFISFVRPFFEDMRLYDTFANKHPVNLLASLMSLKFRCNDWRLLVQEVEAADDGVDGEFGGTPRIICAVWVHGRPLCHIASSSGRYGKIAAAKQALRLLGNMEVADYRALHGCQCVGAAAQGEDNKMDIDGEEMGVVDGETVDEEMLAHGSAI
jgi:endoribonuclease Dicer